MSDSKTAGPVASPSDRLGDGAASEPVRRSANEGGLFGLFVPWSTYLHKEGGARTGGWLVVESGCHIWLGDRNSHGYGRAMVRRKRVLVHRYRYEREIGPIPEAAVLDHFVCDNGRGGCCNPHHCRPVSHRENVLRSPTTRSARQCSRGHPLEGANLLPSKLRLRGKRECKRCAYENARISRLRRLGRLSA